MELGLLTPVVATTASSPEIPSGRQADWREELPVLSGPRVTLRELVVSDAPSLVELLTPQEVSRFIAPPPPTVEAFERFISYSTRLRAAGAAACFVVTPKGSDTAVGLFQIRGLEPGLRTVEWGFALASSFWGTGVFQESAGLILDFLFEHAGAHRVEARAAAKNGRGGRALEKLGAVQEGILRRATLRDGEYLDQVLYAIVADDWQAARARWRGTPHVH